MTSNYFTIVVPKVRNKKKKKNDKTRFPQILLFIFFTGVYFDSWKTKKSDSKIASACPERVKYNKSSQRAASSPLTAEKMRKWTRPLRVLVVQCLLQTSPITQPRVQHIHTAVLVPHSLLLEKQKIEITMGNARRATQVAIQPGIIATRLVYNLSRRQ